MVILNHVIAKKWPSLIKTISITMLLSGLAVMLGADLINRPSWCCNRSYGRYCLCCEYNMGSEQSFRRASVCNDVLSICYSLFNNWGTGLVS